MADFYEDACYLSTSEAEPDSETEDLDTSPKRSNQNATLQSPIQWDDPQALLNTWLGELDNLKVGLENGSSLTAASLAAGGPRPLSVPDVEKLQLHEPRIDSYRFSMANMEDSQDGELDAILKELCALGSQFDQELKDDTQRTISTIPSLGSQGNDGLRINGIGNSGLYQKKTHARNNSGSGNKMRLDGLTTLSSLGSEHPETVHRTDSGLRTDSPDNDSAFSDNISMLSSESSASSGASAARTDASKSSGTSSTSNSSSGTAAAADVDAAARLKAEKIRLALEKMREANVKKLFIKAFTTDGSTKSLLVDEKMSVGHVTRLLADKNHVKMEPKWALVEHLPDLYMERVYEDHEMLVDQLMLWTRDSHNTLLFVERPDKYALFSRPEDFLLLGSSSEKDRNLDDDARMNLLEEFFSGTGVGVPEIEGYLYLKAEGKKAWKRCYFVLRASGLYYSPKGKSKSSKDLVCLATFEVNQVYAGVQWKKKYKAPTDYGFAIKHPKLQSKSSKFIKYLCAEDERSWAQWIMGIRIAKHGKALMDNYRALVEELAQEDLDQLANARSFSLVSMATAPAPTTPSAEPPTTEIADDSSNDTPMNTLERPPVSSKENVRLSRQDSIKSRTSTSSSSGCLSERSSNGTATPTFENAFDSDFPMGTIKRKPSMTPKLPLTSTTRLLVKEVEDSVDGEVTDSANVSRNAHRQSFRKSLTEEINTIRRKTSSISSGSMDLVSRFSIPEQASECVPLDSDLDSLPLPPPPSFSPPEECLSDTDNLPPPPPEAFENLDQFPLPPVELLSTSPTVPSGSKSPSPCRSPPDLTATLKPCLKFGTVGPKVPPKPAAVSCFPRRDVVPDNIYANARSSPSPEPKVGHVPKSPSKKNRRITFDDRVVHSVSPPPPADPVGKPPPPPTLPKRIDPIRSSLKQAKPTPQKLNSPGCAVTPPKEFLKDLQRVMQKKWQVAQKCKADTDITPHEVLGFRDEPPPIPAVPAAYKENSVRAWVAEHYGSGADSHPDTGMGFYENVFVPSNSSANGDMYQNCVELRREYTHPYLSTHPSHMLSTRLSTSSAGTASVTGEERLSRTMSSGSKRFPPPPPKRSETTHLSTRIH